MFKDSLQTIMYHYNMNILETEYESLWHEVNAIDSTSFCDVALYTGDRTLFVNQFYVGKENRGKGIFKAMLDRLCKFADEFQTNISLQPLPMEKESDVKRLKKTYKSKGFAHNKDITDIYILTRTPKPCES